LPGIIVDRGRAEIERRLDASASPDIIEGKTGPVTESVDRGDHVAGILDRGGDVIPGVRRPGRANDAIYSLCSPYWRLDWLENSSDTIQLSGTDRPARLVHVARRKWYISPSRGGTVSRRRVVQ